MLSKLQKSIINLLVEKSLGIKVAILVAVILCGGIVSKGWQEYQYKLANNYIEIHPTASGNQWVISWEDNADDETGFIIERKQGEVGEFFVIGTVDADETSYTDIDITDSDTYCYQIGAFNKAGTAYSDEACIDVTLYEDDYEADVDDNYIEAVSTSTAEDYVESSSSALGAGVISYEFIDKPSEIELNGREFYSFRADDTYNSEYSNDSVSDVSYEINEGNMYYVNSSSLFAITDQAEELDNGFVSMNYDSSNNVDFTLNGNGEEQVASIYLSIGAWTNDEASILISAGENSETITLPKGYTWYYLKIDITFDTLAQVSIKPLGSFGGYSKIKVAGVLLNNATEDDGVVEDEVSEPGIVYFNSASLDSSAEIDVTGLEYVTSEFNTGNTDLSSGSVSALNYEGSSKYADGIYTFVDNGDTVALGNTQFSWDKDNSLSLTLNSENDDFVQTSLYLQAGAWVSTDIKTIELVLTLNGEEHIIELTKGYKWFYIRIDFEFSGEVEVKLNPESSIGGYSKIKFAGLTMQ